MNNLIMILLIALVAINSIMTVFLFKRCDLELRQKMIQTLIVWLVPFLAAIGLYFFYSSQDKESKAFQREFGGGSSTSIGEAGGD